MTSKITLALLTTALFAADPASFAERKGTVRGLLDHGEFAKAAEQAKILNRETPDDVPTYQLLAAAELGLGDYEKAERTLQWMLDLRIGKADAAGWLLVGQFREATGDLDGALDAVNLSHSRVVAGQPPDAQQLLIYSAKLQMQSEKFDNAEKLLQSMSAALPGGEETLAALAQLRILQHREGEASDILNRLVGPGVNPKYFYERARVGSQPADFKAFEVAALQRKNDFPNANRELIFYYAGSGNRPDEALKLAESEAAKRHDVLTLDALAIALYESGKTSEARTVLGKVIAVGTRDPDILRHAARFGMKVK